MSMLTLESRFAQTPRHTTHYLACGPADGPLIVFVHGWPELSLSWRHQLPVFGGLGFRAIAPDMRGYGRSSVYREHADYRQEEVVRDMLDLVDELGRERAVWVGHDWGSPTVWNLARLHPERCHAVANLCVPYFTIENGLDYVVDLVDRALYPAEEYPAGQWDYMRFYEENFARATATFEADPYLTVKLLFRKGDPADAGKPAFTAGVRRQGGWFGPLDRAPDMPRDDDVVSEADLEIYAEALRRNGFFGPDSYYMNHAANAAWTAGKPERLSLPVLFLGARYDYVCETATSGLAEPMRARCDHLTEYLVDSGHWMAQEQPQAVNAALARWLAGSVSEVWPRPATHA
ncbi:MAG: alpha/beta hydrolase [Gammaproteobacteria bacterium]|nr:alpha/beta hydrolase [Gammaproteobacteria bacterium]MCP5200184.1 alpha/beta hydrolase [Gammaproteobacteria bacterium]